MSRYNHRGPACGPHTADEAAAVVDAVEDWQDVFLRVLGRRLVFAADEYYLLADRPVPRGRRLRGLPHARGRRRHGPHLRARVRRAEADDGTGVAAGLLRLGRRRRAAEPATEPLPRQPRDTAAPACRCDRCGPRPRPRAGRRSSPAPYGARVLGAAGRRPRPRRRAGRAGREPVLRRQHRRHRPAGGRGPRPRRWPASPRATATCCPTCACRSGRFLDGTTPDDLPRPVEVVATDGVALRAALGRGRASMTRRPARRSPSSGGPTSASRRSSTASSAGARRSSRSSPGVTRDRKEVEAEWTGPRLPARRHRRLAARRRRPRREGQPAERAGHRATADVVLFVVDAAVGVTEEDDRVADVAARARGRPVLLVANKVDDASREADVWDFAGARPRRARGRSAPCTAGAPATCSTSSSAAPARRRRADGRRAEDDRRRGADDASSPSPSSAGPTSASRRCSTGSSARSGRSSTTCPAPPATPSTRSSRPTTGPIRFVDTAGMRRKAKIDEGTEYYSLVRALQAVDRADVALLVIDATEGVTHQDQRLAERIDAAGCPVVVAAQQVGAARRRGSAPTSTTRSATGSRFLGDAPVLKISALTRQGRAQAAARARRARSRPTTGGCRPGRSTRSIAGRPGRAAGARTAPGSSTPPRARPTRPRSRCSPTASCRRPTCATSSAACARPSTSARPRSSCGSGGGRA